MTHLNNILVAHDFSNCSAQALDFGVEIALETGARLHFLHVEIFHEDRLFVKPSPKSKEEQLKEKLKEDILSSVEKQGFELSDIPDVAYSVLSDYGASSAIVRYCEDKDIDLVILGTHGRRGMARYLKQAEIRRTAGQYYLGSVAETVVRTAPCSVLTIREALNPKSFSTHLNSITIPVDLQDQSLGAIRFARDVAVYYEAKIELLHVIEGWETLPYYDEQNVLIFDQREVEEEVRKHLEKLNERVEGAKVEVNYVVLQGDPASEILRHSQVNESGLIILSANEVAGHWADGVGSTIERVVRLANCPVFTIKSKVFKDSFVGNRMAFE